MSVNQNPQYYENPEGGLNLSDFKDKILRQIHVVAGMTILMSSLAFLTASKRTPNYQASFEILSEPVTVETKVTSSASKSRETTEEITAVTLDEVQLKILKSPEIIMYVVTELKDKYPEISYDSILSTLNLKTNQQKTVLEVFYEHSDREQVKDVLQALAKTYLNYSLERRQVGLNRGLKFLEKQIPRIETQVNISNQKLQRLRKRYNFVDPDTQGSQISKRIDNFVLQQVESKSKLQKTQQIAALVKKELNEESTTSTTAMLIGTARYNALLEELQKIDSQIAKESATFSNRSSVIQKLQEQRRAIVSLINLEIATIQQKIDNQIKLEQEQLQAINEKIATTKLSLKKWLDVAGEFKNIERQLTVSAKQLNELLIQRENLRLDAAQKEAPWKLLTLVGEPQSSNGGINGYILLGTVLGLLLGIGAALLLEKYQNLVHNPNQVQQITNQPILGIIPFNHSYKKLSFQINKIANLIQQSDSRAEKSLLLTNNKNTDLTNLLSSSIEASEAFVFLGSNLGLFEENKDIHSLVITSAVSGEGKSTVALKLAKAISATGMRVLIVDADMRNSTDLISSIALNSTQGLSDFLLSDRLNTDSLIQKSYIEENLFILPSINVSSDIDSSRLIASSKMRDLMKELQHQFELVIYNVASIVDYADVNLLANNTDGVVLVTGLGKLQTVDLKKAIDQLDTSRIPVLGVVINKLTSSLS
ncbi:MAG: polysaccharide biosynthesis tyrosine autokinase [Cyanobacteria bacterium P01_A01_bin.45]